MKYDVDEFLKDPHDCFDAPPPNFNKIEHEGWKSVAEAIVVKGSDLNKYIKYAQNSKKKEEEWKKLPFINMSTRILQESIK